MGDPDLEILDELSKDSLITLGKHLGLSVKRAMRKKEIQQTITRYLIGKGVCSEFDSENTVTCNSDLEIRRLKLQNELELRKLELAEREKEREQNQRVELEKQRMEHELQLKKLEFESSYCSKSTSSTALEDFDVTKYIRLVPPFQEKEVDQYFLHFEKIINNLKWPKEFWTMLLQSVLLGKAREIYTQLSVEQASDYDCVKELILKGYELVPEAYRQKFRNCRKDTAQTFIEFARVKEQLFDRWCTSNKIDRDFSELRQLILVEEFKRCVTMSIRVFLDEQKVKTLHDAARISDDYALTHKSGSPTNSSPFERSHEHKPFGGVSQFRSTTKAPATTGLNPKSTSFIPLKSLPTCNYCKKEGHILSECLKLKRKRMQMDSKRPIGFTAATSLTSGDIKVSNSLVAGKLIPLVNVDSEMQSFQPFVYEGYVSLSQDGSNSIPSQSMF